MMELVSKVQYKKSEKGEFHEISLRNLHETLSLVKNYPWDTERALASVELTCPSVVIEYAGSTYLKIAPYFSGKFVLYHLAANGSVFLHIADQLENTFKWIEAFFEQRGIIRGWERYGFVIMPFAHFKTNPFEYMVNMKAVMVFFSFPIYMMPAILILGWLRSGGVNLSVTLVTMSFLLVISSPLFYFFFNYMRLDRNHYLQISRGHDDFLYGTKGNIRSYRKQDITEINAYGVRHSRAIWSNCEIFIVTFNEGSQIRFTSLLISGTTLREKLHEHQFEEIKMFFPTQGKVISHNIRQIDDPIM